MAVEQVRTTGIYQQVPDRAQERAAGPDQARGGEDGETKSEAVAAEISREARDLAQTDRDIDRERAGEEQARREAARIDTYV